MLGNAVYCKNLPKILLKVYPASISGHLVSATDVAVLREEDAQKSSVMFRNAKGAFNNHVDKRGWVGGLKFAIFVHV